MSSYKSGFIAIAGRPNMGKSTFLNRVLGRKLAIVTPKPQTTRTRILGVHHYDGGQMVFLDTPGIHAKEGNRLNRAMVATAFEVCRDTEIILYFIDAASGMSEADWAILRRMDVPKAIRILVINKVDGVERLHLLPILTQAQAQGEAQQLPFAEMVPISALTGENCDRLLTVLEGYLVEGPPYFPAEMDTDQSEQFLAAEIIREKLFLQLQEELPYVVAVQIESFREEKKVLRLHAAILVERETHKAIVIGKGGAMLKQVGTAARRDLEALFGMKVYLELWVKLEKEWSGNPRLLRELGYTAE